MPPCSSCGKDNREGSKFCQACGTSLTVPETKAADAESGSSPGAICGSCGTHNAPGMKFCKMCGARLDAQRATDDAQNKDACPSCGRDTPPGYQYCQHCGTPLSASPAPATAGSAPASPAPASPASPAGSQQGSGLDRTASPGWSQESSGSVRTASPGGSQQGSASVSAAADPAAVSPPEPGMEKTIVDMDSPGPQPTPELQPPREGAPVAPGAGAGAGMDALRVAPQATPRQAAVSGAIQDVPSGQVVTPETGQQGSKTDKPTLGPGGKRADSGGPASSPTG